MRKIVFSALFAALTLPTLQANASLIEWSITGTVRSISDSSTPFFGIAEGTEISALFVLDDSDVGDPISNNVWFESAVVGAFLSAGTLDTTFNPQDSLFNYVVIRDRAFDALAAMASMTLDNVAGERWALLGLQFRDDDATIFDDESFPTLPALSDLDPFVLGGNSTELQVLVNIHGQFTDIRAEITSMSATDLSAVPLPGALIFFGGALLSLVGLRVSRQVSP